MVLKRLKLQNLLPLLILILIGCNSNKFYEKKLSYIKWDENGGYYFLDIKIDDVGVVTGRSGYICCPTYSVDSWDGVVSGTLKNDSISGKYTYEAEGEAYSKKVVIGLHDDYAVFQEDGSDQIVLDLETPDRISAHPRTLRKANKNSVKIAFENWKNEQIRLNKLQANCPELGSDKFEKLTENYSDENRWAFKRILQTFYNDFNGDNIEDALIVFEREDCVQGGGYVGDYQEQLIFLSKGDKYFLDNRIVRNLKNELNRNSIGYFADEVAYVELETVTDNAIKGIYYDWEKGNPSGNPSIKKSFDFYYLKNEIQISTIVSESKHFFKRGMDRYDVEDFKGSISEFSKALSIDANFIDAVKHRANAKYFSNDFKGALIDYNKEIDLDPNGGEYHFRGNVKFELKDYVGAITDYKIAISIGGNKEVLEERIRDAEIAMRK